LPDRMPIYVGDQAIEEFISFCQRKKYDKFLVVADDNTYKALGGRVLHSLQQAGWDVQLALLHAQGLHADSHAISRVLAVYDGSPRVFVAVGSGTITDIVRFISHRSRNEFVAFPSAASVDAYTSHNAAISIADFKTSVLCQTPIAIFTDLATVVASPRRLTASGIADLLGKFTSAADWKMSHMIWEAEFDKTIFLRVLENARRTTRELEKFQYVSAQSMAALMECHFESGFCMADFGNSAPASGGEHHIAHVWEMIAHLEGKPGWLHGEAVGVATIIEAGWYDRLRITKKDNAYALLQRANLPDKQTQEESLRRSLPLIAEKLINSNPILLRLVDASLLEVVKERILDNWIEIQAIAESVPPVSQIRAWLSQIGAPVDPVDLKMDQDQVRLGTAFGPYMRDRFSINILRLLLGW